MKLRLALTFIVLFLCSLYFAFDPGLNIYFPKCPSNAILHYRCPLCGTQRALHQLLHLNITEAMALNFYFVALFPFAVAYITAKAANKGNAITRKIESKTTVIAFITVSMAWCVFRNIYNL